MEERLYASKMEAENLIKGLVMGVWLGERERAKSRVSQGPLILRSLEELSMKMEGAANEGLGKTFFS